MYTLSKTTTKFAAARGLTLEVWNCENNTLLDVYDTGEDSEPMFSLLINHNGSFSWYSNIYLADHIKAELPAHYADELELRSMLCFLANELNAANLKAA